ncbi:tetratricopeptide repeat protein [Microbaculum sp. FT89]|uniref:tetratricopeptide repeat protein n=1 Tax=Microbaculum sp. FT89 TaxID=3447298 RepID=UPI003F52F557
MLKCVLVGVVGTVLSISVAFAGPLEDGNAAYERGDYAEAVKWYLLAAKQGNAMAWDKLGGMYDFGEGVPQDYVLAHMWFNLAAAQGDKGAKEKRDLTTKK